MSYIYVYIYRYVCVVGRAKGQLVQTLLVVVPCWIWREHETSTASQAGKPVMESYKLLQHDKGALCFLATHGLRVTTAQKVSLQLIALTESTTRFREARLHRFSEPIETR